MDIISFSSPIIKSLEKGDLKKANALIGHPYFISGVVVKGQMLGKSLGYPTANLSISATTPLLIPRGVYAVKVNFSGSFFLGMANIGTRPTVKGKTLTVEVNLFHFNGDLYGKELTVSFIQRIRDEKKFDDLQSLSLEIARDKNRITKLFASMD